MQTTLLSPINITIERQDILKSLKMTLEDEDAQRMDELLEEARALMRPKAVFGIAAIDARGDDHVIVEGTRLDSKLVVKNLAPVHRIFPYVVTCGTELEQWAAGLPDYLDQYWADAIMLLALRKASAVMLAEMKKQYGLEGKLSFMSPGSLAEWPLRQQRPLFALLGDVEARIGVRLTDSCLMLPAKSVSGFYFPDSGSYTNCALCPLERCPSRSAPRAQERPDG